MHRSSDGELNLRSGGIGGEEIICRAKGNHQEVVRPYNVVAHARLNRCRIQKATFLVRHFHADKEAEAPD